MVGKSLDYSCLFCYWAWFVHYVDVGVWIYALDCDILVFSDVVLVLVECPDSGTVYIVPNKGLAVERQGNRSVAAVFVQVGFLRGCHLVHSGTFHVHLYFCIWF